MSVLVSKAADRFGAPALRFIRFSGGPRRFSKPIGLAWLDRFFTEHQRALPDRVIVDRSKISATKPWSRGFYQV
jgi:hypothetical protein